MSNQNRIETYFTNIFAYYCLFTTIASIILNPLVMIICLKSKRLRSNSTFKLLTINAINDILVCLSWNQESFTRTILKYIFNSPESIYYCRWVSIFLQYTTLDIQSWIMVSISVDRLLSMTVNKWSKFYFTGYRPYIYAAILSLFMIALNVHELFTIGYIFDYNEIYKYYYNFTYNYSILYVKCHQTNRVYKFNWYEFANQVSGIYI